MRSLTETPANTGLGKRGCREGLTGAKCQGTVCFSGVAWFGPQTRIQGTLLALLPPGKLQAQAQVGGSPASSGADLIPQEVAQASVAFPSPCLLAGRHVVITKLATVVTEVE